jgi:phage terminase large subunit-like protein
MWSTLNDAASWLVALLLTPVRGLAWPWQMLVLALPVTALALLVFRYASSQAGIRRVQAPHPGLPAGDAPVP